MGKTKNFCPSTAGAKSWNSTAYSPRTGFLYTPTNEICTDITPNDTKPTEGRFFMNGDFPMKLPPNRTTYSHVDAWDPVTGKRIWSMPYKFVLLSSMLATAGDLVFTGDPEGNFFALDARSGNKLWSFPDGRRASRRVDFLFGQRPAIHRGDDRISADSGRRRHRRLVPGGKFSPRIHVGRVRVAGGIAMKRALLFLALAALATLSQAQDLVKQGEAVFSKSCATGYCHGARGTNGGAPRLAARGFDQAFIANTVQRGIPSTAMPAFGTTLSRADLTAVVAYVASLNGVTNLETNSGPSGAPATRLSGDAARGRALFSDAVRSFGRCSTCHEIGGFGIPPSRRPSPKFPPTPRR